MSPFRVLDVVLAISAQKKKKKDLFRLELVQEKSDLEN